MAKKIEVKHEILRDAGKYRSIIQLLKEVKLVQGNLALNSTLNRHPDIKKFLLEFQVENMKWLEKIINS